MPTCCILEGVLGTYIQQEASTTRMIAYTTKNQTNIHDIALLNDTKDRKLVTRSSLGYCEMHGTSEGKETGPRLVKWWFNWFQLTKCAS